MLVSCLACVQALHLGAKMDPRGGGAARFAPLNRRACSQAISCLANPSKEFKQSANSEYIISLLKLSKKRVMNILGDF